MNTFHLTEDATFEDMAEAIDVIADSGASTRMTKHELRVIAAKLREAAQLEDEFFDETADDEVLADVIEEYVITPDETVFVSATGDDHQSGDAHDDNV